MLEYRFNLLVNGIYVWIYAVGLYIMVELVYTKTDSLMSFNKAELQILFGLSMMHWMLVNFVYFEGFLNFMNIGVKNGEFDFAMIKPVHPQFLVAIRYSALESGFQLLIAMFYTGWLIWQYSAQLTLLNIIIFCGMWVICNVIIYNVLASHAATAFFTEQSMQLLRLTQSMNDQAQFPTSMYARPLQMVLTFILPVAFMAYVPGLFLFGEATGWTYLGVVIGLVVSTLVNKWSWKIGMKNYSSASS